MLIDEASGVYIFKTYGGQHPELIPLIVLLAAKYAPFDIYSKRSKNDIELEHCPLLARHKR